MFAGIDTSSHVACMAIYNLAKHPEIKNELIKELNKIGAKVESESDISKILEIKLLTNIINETLRLHSPAVSLFPRVALEGHFLNSIRINKKEIVNVSMYSLCMNPVTFPQPNQFLPNRWDSINLANPFQFIPFSAG
jgi:cytochrome P450